MKKNYIAQVVTVRAAWFVDVVTQVCNLILCPVTPSMVIWCLRRCMCNGLASPAKFVKSFATWQHLFVDSNFLSYPAPLSLRPKRNKFICRRQSWADPGICVRGPSPFPLPSLPLPPFPYFPFPPLLSCPLLSPPLFSLPSHSIPFLSLPSPPLRSRPPVLRQGGLVAPNGFGQSPAAKRFLVNIVG